MTDTPWKTDGWFTSPWNFEPEVTKDWKFPEKIQIHDVTLRDGEQSPGASMTRDEKLRIARQLERMKVNVIEAGFAAASNGDFESVRAIAEVVKDSTICSLARANENDIRRSGEAIKPAASGRIHTFIATSPIHMEKKLRMKIRSNGFYSFGIQHEFWNFLPTRIPSHRNCPGMALVIDDVIPEFVLKPLHESNHHDHHVHTKSYPNNSQKRKERHLPLRREQLLPR